jgi:hypothetical protein
MISSQTKRGSPLGFRVIRGGCFAPLCTTTEIKTRAVSVEGSALKKTLMSFPIANRVVVCLSGIGVATLKV